MTYRRRDPDQIVATLERRIAERFPDAALVRVCAELTAMARESRAESAQLARPHRGLRALGWLVALAGLGGLGWLAALARPEADAATLSVLVQTLDAGFSLAVVVGGALFFLVTLEARWKRARALDRLHALRSIIHVVDMQQLTKDPSALLAGGPRTAHSPERLMTPFELTRYLDYCSEMLSLAAKIAALHAERARDAVVIAAASDLGHTAADLTLKIWQKIALVQHDAAVSAASLSAPPDRPK